VTTQLQQQVSNLVSFARTQSPTWRGEWTLALTPETFCLLDDAAALGKLPYEGAPKLYQPLRVQMLDGCAIEVLSLLWDIVMISPGLGDDSPQPPTYWLDLVSGKIAQWTQDTLFTLNSRDLVGEQDSEAPKK
jgi:hypothetical protein